MYKEINLDNKLKLILLKNKNIHTVNIGIFIGAGAKDEDTFHNYGCAHFLEHMMFKGTENISATEIAEALDDLGGYGNAYTNNEFTVFYNKVLQEDSFKAVDILYDMLFNSTMDEDEIEKEKKVIVEEINMYEDEAGSFILEEFSKNLFSRQGLGNSILGEKKYVKKINKKILLNFYQQHYVPEKMVVVVTGNYNEKLIGYLKRKFSALESAEQQLEVNKKVIINNFSFALHEKAKISQIYFALGGEGVSKNDSEYIKTILFNNILGGNSSSYLFQKLREELSLCYDISSFTTAFENTGELVISGGVNVKQFPLALREIVKILEEIKVAGIKKIDFERAKKQLKRQIVMSLDNMHNMMFSLGIDVLYYSKPKLIDELIAEIDGISYSSFNKFVKRYLKALKLNLCVLAPKGTDDIEKQWEEIAGG